MDRGPLRQRRPGRLRHQLGVRARLQGRLGAARACTWPSNLFTSSAWGNSGDFSYDVGAAVVAPAGGTALTDRVGGRGISFNYNRSQNYVSYGYPAAPPFTGERLWTCNSPLQT